jgi:hypothetical protein
MNLIPFSLVTTYGFSFDFFNSYLDISIHCFVFFFTKKKFTLGDLDCSIIFKFNLAFRIFTS